MKHEDLIAIDVHTHAEVSCRQEPVCTENLSACVVVVKST
jgi:hypothetical protein